MHVDIWPRIHFFPSQSDAIQLICVHVYRGVKKGNGVQRTVQRVWMSSTIRILQKVSQTLIMLIYKPALSGHDPRSALSIQ